MKVGIPTSIFVSNPSGQIIVLAFTGAGFTGAFGVSPIECIPGKMSKSGDGIVLNHEP
jgi:hypothetical protein